MEQEKEAKGGEAEGRKMERLTKRSGKNITYEEDREIRCSSYCSNCSRGTRDCTTIKCMVEKLAAYEDAEERGLLLRLPCKMGDTVYVVGSKCLANIVSESKCELIDCEQCSFDKEIIVFEKVVTRDLLFTISLKENPNFIIGKTVFLTKEEAEAKLKEISGKGWRIK